MVDGSKSAKFRAEKMFQKRGSTLLEAKSDGHLNAEEACVAEKFAQHFRMAAKKSCQKATQKAQYTNQCASIFRSVIQVQRSRACRGGQVCIQSAGFWNHRRARSGTARLTFFSICSQGVSWQLASYQRSVHGPQAQHRRRLDIRSLPIANLVYMFLIVSVRGIGSL